MHKNYSENISTLLDDSRREARRHHSKVVRAEHLLMAMLKKRGTITDKILDEMHINRANLAIDCETELLNDVEEDKLPAEVLPELNSDINKLILLAALEARMYSEDTVDEKHLLLAILHDNTFNQARVILEKNNMNYDNLTQYFNKKKENSKPIDSMELSEEENPDSQASDKSPNTKAEAASQNRVSEKTPTIDAFSVDLSQMASEGKLDPVVGRTREITRLQEILCRRKKNNPILIGEPGVGKSAIVEGLAQQLANKTSNTPIALRSKRIVALDMPAMVAGTKYRGQFEERIKNLIKELEANSNIIIFIDEIHTIIGAGSAAGTMDAANILKPALARGTIQCIGATTLDEYRKSIEKDGALERRFQKIIVDPSTTEETMHILSNIRERYEEFHHVSYSDEVLLSCVKMSQRYITDRAFPDKAIDVLDETGARKRLQQTGVPTDISALEDKISAAKKNKLEAVRNQKFELAANYRDIQTQCEEELRRLTNNWQSSDNTSREVVTVDDVADVVSTMTGIPVQRVAESEGERLRNMASNLKKEVIAQDKAIDQMVRAIQRARLGLHDHNRPIGAFMFLGPTGVGKTLLAKKLASEMFGSDDSLIRIDMSEYSEAFNTSRLVGSPPGYVGYEEGGQLTERVRRKPYSIILLDEIEKANSSVFNILLQVLDEGRLTDGNGRLIDFRNTVIIMTSNTGSRQLREFAHQVGFASDDISSQNKRAHSIIQKSLSKQFAPEFLGRLDEIIMFEQLDNNAVREIVKIELHRLETRIEQLGYKLSVKDNVIDEIVKQGFDPQYGARPLRRAIQSCIEDRICERILSGNAIIGEEIVINSITEE